MKHGFFAVCLLLFSLHAFAQDTLYLRNGRKLIVSVDEVVRRRIIYRNDQQTRGPKEEIYSRHISRIVYANGQVRTFSLRYDRISYRQLMENKYDSSFVKKNFVRIYLTDLHFNKLSLGYEHLLNKSVSLDIDAHYRYSLGVSDPLLFTPLSWYYPVYGKGYEFKLGMSRHYHLKTKRVSLGAALSYGAQGFSRESFHTEGTRYFSFTHRRNAIGAFVKLSCQFTPQYSGFEFFISPGFYAAFTRTAYQGFLYDYPSKHTADPDGPKIKDPALKEGFALIPYVNCGFAYVIKQPQKGWYKELKHRRDSLRIHGKNVLLFNATELIENAVGLTYMRISYPHALSYFTSVALGLKNQKGPGISNALLAETSKNYRLMDKNFDVMLGLNYNLSWRQRSFPFIGLSGRMARFTGFAFKDPFLLNKYYVHLNAGWMLRSGRNGLSLLGTVSPGRYFNEYLSGSSPFRTTGGFINTVYISVQLGYSF